MSHYDLETATQSKAMYVDCQTAIVKIISHFSSLLTEGCRSTRTLTPCGLDVSRQRSRRAWLSCVYLFLACSRLPDPATHSEGGVAENLRSGSVKLHALSTDPVKSKDQFKLNAASVFCVTSL